MTYRVVEKDMRGNVLSVIATGKTERNAEAIADMAAFRRGVEESFFAVEPEL